MDDEGRLPGERREVRPPWAESSPGAAKPGGIRAARPVVAEKAPKRARRSGSKVKAPHKVNSKPPSVNKGTESKDVEAPVERRLAEAVGKALGTCTTGWAGLGLLASLAPGVSLAQVGAELERLGLTVTSNGGIKGLALGDEARAFVATHGG